MPRRKRRNTTPLPLMFAELAFASWETIARRTLMMATGTCTPAEYQRMVFEKAHAAQRSGAAMTRRRNKNAVSAILAPWHSGATKNARRLRRPKKS
jgi:hypothetical protein